VFSHGYRTPSGSQTEVLWMISDLR
jgi:hypothetical protein